MNRNHNVAVVIPCFNEQQTVRRVVEEAKKFLPGADVYVYDNNSTDSTVTCALEAGAIVRSEKRQGKGFVIRRAFTDIEADTVVMVDGDDTYDLSKAPEAITYFKDNNLDFLNIRRIATASSAYRTGHVLGNKILTKAIGMIFGDELDDMLSGYKVLSRRFIRSFPVSSSGFEIETELLVHALELGIPVAEIDAPYKERPEGSFSKLSTYRDGFRIALTILRLVQLERPLLFFSLLAGSSMLLSLLLGGIVVTEFLNTGLVPRLPTAVLAGFLALTSIVLSGVGLTLDLVKKTRTDQKKLAFLAFRSK